MVSEHLDRDLYRLLEGGNEPTSSVYLVSDDKVFPTDRDNGRQPVPAAGLWFLPLEIPSQHEELRVSMKHTYTSRG